MSRKCEGLRSTELAVCRKQHDRIDEMMKSATESIHKLLDSAYKIDDLPDGLKEDNYILPKAVITIWCRKEPYSPLNESTKEDVARLERFLR